MKIRTLAAALAASVCIVAITTPAQAQQRAYNIPAGSLSAALDAFGRQSGRPVIYRADDVRGAQSTGFRGNATSQVALDAILADTGFDARFDDSGAIAIVRARPVSLGGNPSAERAAELGEVADADIVVTGSLIRGVQNSASPVESYSREDIARSGLGTTEEFVQSLSQNFAGANSGRTVAGLLGGEGSNLNVGLGTGVDLRGLGSDSTLTLLNGRRLAPAGIGNVVDISLIPLGAIERIDVLTDGASAIYGSDAIAGVVNVILRDRYQGGETRLRYGRVTDGDHDEFQAAQLLGQRWTTGSALISYEYLTRSPLDAADRDFTSTAAAPSFLLPEEERHSVLAAASQEIGSQARLSGNAYFTQRDSVITVNTGLPTTQDSHVEQYGGTLGAEIEMSGGWRLDLAGVYSAADTFALSSIPAANASFTVDMDSSVLEFDAKADGPLFSAPGGLARLAIGGQFRHESYESTGDAFATTGALDRDVWAAFGELFVPIFGQENERPGLYRLELTLAGRLDDYSDFGSSFNPKVGMLWSPVRGLHLRGTWARSFRAPLLSELDETPNGAQILPLPDPTSPAGASIAAVIVGNNSALGPERSTSWTLGFDLAPPSLPGLDFGVTYFNFDFTDRIATPVPNTALFTVLQNENLYAEAIVRNPTPAAVDAALDGLFIVNPGGFPLSAVQVILDNRIGNIASRKQDGIDVIGSYTFQAASSRFVLSANATYLFSIRDRLTSTAPIQDRLDVVFNPVDFRLRTGATWSRSALSASLFVNYTDGYRDTRTAPTTAVSSWTTVDATLRYRRDPGPGVLDGLTIALQVQNLFDEDPPFVANQLGLNFDATNASARGRFVALQVIKEW